MNNYRLVSLFCGCGGLDLGFVGNFEVLNKKYKKNKIDVVYANDFNDSACKTYNYNFEHKCECRDVCQINESELPECDIVIGGFPCQDFSLAGNRKGFAAERGVLYKQMLRIVEAKRPKVFVAENVEGIMLELDGIVPIEIIKKDFSSIGYKVKYQLFNTADYGVPETRKRVIIVGVRDDINKEYEYPKKTCKNWISVKTAIDDLWDKLGTGEVPNHSFKDYSKAKFYPGGHGQGNRKLCPNIPSITIRAEHHGNIEGHYRTLDDSDPENVKNWRRLSVRECARIQTFPDNFVFPCGASSAYRQIGNAVPPVFGWHIAKSITDFLDLITKNDKNGA
jgi:DNA (cytosine-5)-methyltransferase 1